jgi:hypothetical protein
MSTLTALLCPEFSASSTASASDGSSKAAFARIASLNIRELANNAQDVHDMALSTNLDVLAIQESLYATAVDVPGYFWLAPPCPPQASRISSSRSAFRGVGFLIKDELRSLVKVCNVKGKSNIETFWIKICGKNDFLDTFVCSAYASGPHHPAAHCQAFFSALAEKCIFYQARGDVLLLGDFNSRIGSVSGDSESNANGPRFLEMLRIAFGADNSGNYECLLNSSGANRGLPTRVEGHHKSIIDFLVCAPSGQSRVTKVHVETKNQLHGANGCGSDHNLMLLDWKPWNIDNASTNPKRQTPPYRLCWDKDALGDPAVAALYSSILTPGPSTWHNALSDLLQSSPDFLASLNPGARQVLTDGMYASWSFRVRDALCYAVPVKAVGRRSKEWSDPDLQKLLDKRRAAHASLTAYCNTMQYNTLESFSADFAWQE